VRPLVKLIRHCVITPYYMPISLSFKGFNVKYKVIMKGIANDMKSMSLSADYARNVVYLHISVGIATIKEQDFGINVRFITSTGNHWVITQSYSMFRQLDSIISKTSKKISYIPFPILDKYTLRDLYKVCVSYTL
jgi:hypothetical protein